MRQPVVMSLSPRGGGNSDQAADLFARCLHGESHALRLRDHHVEPCTGCGACAAAGVCRMSGEDAADDLFTRLDQASGLVLTAPVYFYHLPSQAKAWIDRAQSRYLARQAGLAAAGAVRPAYAVLVAGRPRGEKLFDGILPTLRYFLDVLDFRLEGTALLRGIDEAGEFSRCHEAMQAVRALAGRSGW
ncbi:flavodoxin family protein [Desulfomicrobium salsuginis]